jgi:hypothetical protein
VHNIKRLITRQNCKILRELIKYYFIRVIEKNGMGAACSTYGRQAMCIQGLLVGKPEGKNPLVRPRRRWEDNIKIDIQQVG